MTNQLTDILPPPPPSPYEYALLSETSYSDMPTQEGTKLYSIGWRLLVNISDESGYCGSLWKNDEQRQIVIAHRGSQNITSWATDIESIMQLKPGTFINKAIELLQHELVQDYKKQGYRLSATGHSLGGFLAQICVYWAQRSEFEATYYPNMSAVVFDSPGVVDILEVIEPNLEREKGRIDIRHLNIHNFCAMPTFASTYGRQTGTIWHVPGIPAEGVASSFINGHRMQYILAGFDQETGQPSRFRMMRDWPQANYSAYAGVDTLLETTAVEAIKLPLLFLNNLYKFVRERFGYSSQKTLYEQVFVGRGEVNAFLREVCKNRFPEVGIFDFSTQLSLAIEKHYSALPAEASRRCMDIHHFDKEVQEFFIKFDSCESSTELDQALESQYDEKSILLASYQLKSTSAITEVVLKESYNGTIFDFQSALQTLFKQKGVFSIIDFLRTEKEKWQKRIGTIERKLPTLEKDSEEIRKKLDELSALKAQVEVVDNQLRQLMKPSDLNNHATLGKKVVLHSTVLNAKGTRAIHASSSKDYEEKRHTERNQLLHENPDITEYYENSMILTAEGSEGLHINAEANLNPTVSQLMTTFARDRYKTCDERSAQPVNSGHKLNISPNENGDTFSVKK